MTANDIELAETFARVARSLLAADDLDAVLGEIVATAIRVIEGCEHAGIDIVERKTVRPVAPSSDVAERVDAIQTEVGEGPCLDAIVEHEVFRTGDLPGETRWPAFAARAHAETGIRSITGFRLFAEADTMGALNLYSSQPDAFDDEAVAIGSVLAAHAGVALSTARERAGLKDALASRDLIGQAKGILMSQGDVDEDEAFTILRRASQRLNIKLRDVAERVVHPPEAPDPPEAPG